MKRKASLFLVFLIVSLFVGIPVMFLTPLVSAVGEDQGSFGFTTIGTTYSNYVADTIIGSAFTCTQTGHADSMSVALYVASGTLSVNMSCGYYLHSDLSLVGNTTASSVTLTTTKTWFAFTFPTPKPDVVGGSEYVLVFFVDYVATSFRCARENNVTTDQGHYESRDYALGYSNPLSATHLTREYSIYCNYTISPPYGIKYGVTPPYPMGGDTVIFPIHWYTDTGTLSHCNIEMNDTGTAHNSTFTAFPASQTDYMMNLNITIETEGNCYITWRGFCNTSLDIMGVTSTATFWASTKNQELWVEDLTGVEQDFPVTGSAPYLNNDTANYLKTPDIGDNESWFTFHFYAGTVEQTWLNIEGCSLLLNITLYNGVANYTYQVDFPETLVWQTINVTDAVDIVTKVNVI